MSYNLKPVRDSQLDILKGIGILFVVYAHICISSSSAFLYLFHMPLFFFLSGAALSFASNLNFSFKKRFRRIMVPYFIFSVLSFIYWCFFELKFRSVHNIKILPGILSSIDWRIQQFLNIFIAFSQKDAFLYNVVLWFLPCLFVSMLVYIVIQKTLGRHMVWGIGGLAMIPFVFPHIMLPWCSELALIALPFIYMGRYLYFKVKALNIVVGGGIFLLLGYVIIYFINPHVDMRIHETGDWWSFYSIAFAFIFALCIFSKLLVGKDKVFEWLGRNSLTIMCIHEPLKRIILVVVSRISGLEISIIRSSVLMSLLCTCFLIMLLFPLVKGINKYVPIAVGK